MPAAGSRPRDLAAALREQVDRGYLKPGDVVPVVRLALLWGVAPGQVAQAVRDLAAEGRVRLYPTWGYLVQPYAPPPRRCPACGYCAGTIGHAAECGPVRASPAPQPPEV